MNTLNINLKPVYTIHVDSGLLKQTQLLAELSSEWARNWVIIVDEQLINLYGQPLYRALSEYFNRLKILSIPSGESHKTRQTKQQLEDKLLELGCDKKTGLIAVGGGVTTDIVGFTGATFYRGIPVIYVPTTLLAMVDASIGGKTAVNTSYGKNLIGQFYQPRSVWIDPHVLTTISPSVYSEGIAEVIKHALLGHSQLWHLLANHSEAIKQQEPQTLLKLIRYSLQIKKQLVEADEKETYGPRQLLNLGHTVAHALEKVYNYQISHGYAVALGLIVEARIAELQGVAVSQLTDSIVSLVKLYQLPIALPKPVNRKTLIDAMYFDKKNRNNAIHCCLLQDIGQPYIFQGQHAHAVPQQIVEQALDIIH